MTRDYVEVRRNAYYDSVTLMQASKRIRSMPGVVHAMLAMASAANIELLADMAFDVKALRATAEDLMVAVRVSESRTDDELHDTVAHALDLPSERTGVVASNRTLRSAAKSVGANIALVSVPGRHAFVEAMDAIACGLHVVVFSDNVSLEHEILLKRAGQARDLLVMGPDCGTVIADGIGLGFANAVAQGPVGVVAASGTGIQQICALLDTAGIGISHALGVGGRDTSEAVGASSTLRGIEELESDASTDVIVVCSKTPSPDVAAAIERRLQTCAKPSVVAFLGVGRRDLTQAVETVLRTLQRRVPRWPSWQPQRLARPWPGGIRGLFSGGTLCEEAAQVVRAELATTAGPASGDGRHHFVDFGADEFTRTRPHPMLDASARVEAISAAGRDENVAVVLMDVVLGYGTADDPASELTPTIADAQRAAAEKGRDLDVIVSLCGTSADPQGHSTQVRRFVESGARVFLSNAEAARAAASQVRIESR